MSQPSSGSPASPRSRCTKEKHTQPSHKRRGRPRKHPLPTPNTGPKDPKRLQSGLQHHKSSLHSVLRQPDLVRKPRGPRKPDLPKTPGPVIGRSQAKPPPKPPFRTVVKVPDTKSLGQETPQGLGMRDSSARTSRKGPTPSAVGRDARVTSIRDKLLHRRQWLLDKGGTPRPRCRPGLAGCSGTGQVEALGHGDKDRIELRRSVRVKERTGAPGVQVEHKTAV